MRDEFYISSMIKVYKILFILIPVSILIIWNKTPLDGGNNLGKECFNNLTSQQSFLKGLFLAFEEQDLKFPEIKYVQDTILLNVKGFDIPDQYKFSSNAEKIVLIDSSENKRALQLTITKKVCDSSLIKFTLWEPFSHIAVRGYSRFLSNDWKTTITSMVTVD